MCSLAGLGCTVCAIYFSLKGVFAAAIIGMVWAVAFDWADGLIARRMTGRSDSDKVFGGQLDVLIDIVSYGVTPAILILSYGNFEPVLLGMVFVLIAAAAIRLSYFSTYGLAGGSHYTGLALDNNSLILVGIFTLESRFSPGMFAPVLTTAGLVLAALNVSQLQTPKLSGNPINVLLLATYTVVITGILGWQLI
ncbi:MAG: CDP-alcohol phosphatidyltransferase family protein [Candidatus Synoicihabitans palmerolidicus]|nr:CDP-alcohol phosphatidyltransferase family protein [Candidatus Synoicihabitans palmerolidicus]